MSERRSDPLLPRYHFFWRVILFVGISATLVSIALGIGILGYHYLGGLPWINAFVNASSILGGMGPVDPITTHVEKLFASAYALR